MEHYYFRGNEVVGMGSYTDEYNIYVAVEMDGVDWGNNDPLPPTD